MQSKVQKGGTKVITSLFCDTAQKMKFSVKDLFSKCDQIVQCDIDLIDKIYK